MIDEALDRSGLRGTVRSLSTDAARTYKPDPRRQSIVDSWPADVDDGAARRDWGFSPKYDFELAFSEYLLPNIVKKK